MDFVLVHGTTQSPACWDRLAAALARRGHRAETVDLPTDRPGLLAADYARLAAGQVGGKVDDPVVVAHSGGGLLLPAVAREVGARHLVWLAAAIPDPEGRSFRAEIQAAGSEMFSEEWRSLTEPPTADPVLAAYFLFHDCDLATLRWGLSTLRLFQPAAVYTQAPGRPGPAAPSAGPGSTGPGSTGPGSTAPGSTAPGSTFVLPLGDRTLRPDWMRSAARDRLGVEPVEIDGGHCPHVSRPEAVAEILDFTQRG
jgi:pimeloyl-ACP methyl ester carboxylesterase